MQRMITHVALVVRDYDAASASCTGPIGCARVEDSLRPEEPGKRRVPIAPQA